MLKQRLLTAALLIPLTVWAVLKMPELELGILLAVLALMGGWEWARLAGIGRLSLRLLFMLATAAAMTGLWHLLGQRQPYTLFLLLTLGGWGVALIAIGRYQGGQGERSPVASVAYALVGIWLLAACWSALLALHRAVPVAAAADDLQGPRLVLYVLVMIWVADSGAYFSGRRFGHSKLARAVSPGKTLEGLYGGLAAVAAYAMLCGYLFGLPGIHFLKFVALSLVATLFSVIGDLFESLLKRQVGMKDSGRLLPGHGGVLDRVDSLLAAAPMFLLGLYLFGVVK